MAETKQRLPGVKKSLSLPLLAYQLSFLWNNLPTNIKQISNSLKFKTTLKNHPLSSWPIV